MNYFSVLLLLFLALESQGAGFDCAKANTKVEKIICFDKQLNKADEELSDYYRIDMELYNESWSARLRDEQRNWLKNTRNICTDFNCLMGAYQKRLIELVDMRNDFKLAGPSSDVSNFLLKKDEIMLKFMSGIISDIVGVIDNDLEDVLFSRRRGNDIYAVFSYRTWSNGAPSSRGACGGGDENWLVFAEIRGGRKKINTIHMGGCSRSIYSDLKKTDTHIKLGIDEDERICPDKVSSINCLYTKTRNYYFYELSNPEKGLYLTDENTFNGG